MVSQFKIIGIFSLFAFITACQAPTGDSLEDKKALLKSKKDEVRALEQEINDLKEEILVLDPPKEKDPISVESMVIKPKLFERYVDLQARIEADDVVMASSEIGGRILQLNVKEGQYVKRGQLIAVTDMSTLEKQIAEIETGLSLATTVYDRQKRLWEQEIGSEIQYLEAKTNKESLEKSLETLNSQIAKKNIYSPINGIVDREFLSSGEMASPGLPIVQILNTSKVKVVADVQEEFLSAVRKGDKVDVYFPALDMTIQEGIDLIGRTIDPANRTFKIEMNLDSKKGQLKPNLLAEVKIKDYSQEQAIVIPLQYIQEEVTGDKYVYIADNSNGKKKARKVPIEIGESNTTECIINVGINDGDELITAGSSKISNGDPLNIISQS